MKKVLKYGSLAFTLILAAISPANCSAETLIYKVTMRLRVPRVYDNMQSLGYRKAQWQRIIGYIAVDKDLGSCKEEGEDLIGEPEICSYGFVNNTHKVNGKKVTYEDDSIADNVMWRFIGSNKTGIFKNTCVKFDLDLDPSYNIGDDEPDNTLIIRLSGIGMSESHITGNVTGQIGCGCMAYGHISPTRDICGNVRDITPLYGRFTMRLKQRIP